MEKILEEIQTQLAQLLAATPKEPIVPDALYPLAHVARLCGYEYTSVWRAATSGDLKVIETPVGRQAWGRDVKEWINAGGRTGRSRATMESRRAA